MSKKFLIQKVTCIALVVVMTLCSSITALAAPSDLEYLAGQNSEVAISQTIGVQDTQLAEQSLISMQLQASTPATTVASSYPSINPNFPDLTAKMDTIFGMRVMGSQKNGILMTAWAFTSPDVSSTNANYDAHESSVDDMSKMVYGFAMTNPRLQTMLTDSAIKTQLAEAMQGTFSDEVPAWAAPQVAMGVYYGVLNGLKDAQGRQVFQGSRSVTRAEWATMLSKFYKTDAEVKAADTSNRNYKKISDISQGAWYTPYWSSVRSNMTSINGMTKVDMESGMTRAECAMYIAWEFFSDEIASYKPTSNPFSDLKNNGKTLTEDMNEIAAIREQNANPGKGVYEMYYNAILFLQSKGIMNGDGAGKVNPTAQVTRNEAAILMASAAREYGKVMGK